MSHPIPTEEYGNDNGREPDIDAIAEARAEMEDEMTPADRWNKIEECVQNLKALSADLEEMCKDFNKSAL